MRVAVFTDRVEQDPDWKGAYVWQIILGLIESHHEVLVLTNNSQISQATHSRLLITHPAPSWSVRYLPRVVQTVLSFKPEVIHTFALRADTRWPSLTIWPFLAALTSVLPNVRCLASLFDSSEHTRHAAQAWYDACHARTVFCTTDQGSMHWPVTIVPLDLPWTAGAHSEIAIPSTTLIPAPVSEWENGLEGLRYLREFLIRHPQLTAHIIGGWGNCSASERRQGWQTLGGTGARVLMLPALDFQASLSLIETMDSLWLNPLPPTAFKRLLCEKICELSGKKNFQATPLHFSLMKGCTANAISRMYRAPKRGLQK